MIWKKIEGYNYSINELGQVRNNKTNKILKPVPDGRDNYLVVCLRGNGKNHMCRIHRLLGLYFLSCPTDMQIDHIDGDRHNNNLSNLRVVTNQQNHYNRTTAKGCYWNPTNNNWRAVIGINGKSKHLGTYPTEEEARAAYLEGKKIHHVIP
jgi:hypothetical protein